MRTLTALAWLTAAALPTAALAAAPLSYDDARHLLNRTGFGATDAEIRRFVGATREDAARTLLSETRTAAITPPPAWTGNPGPLRYPRKGENASEMEKKQFQQEQVRDGLELRGWWLDEMLVTPSPLTERMTLFWHNHFVSGQQKVKLAELMYRQNVTLRANALGRFGDLLHAIARDPAMVIYLDNAQNRKGTPNENFAREVMELFTLGEGHYSEQDIKEAARAFTGWSLDRETGQFVFRRFIHDYGQKTVLGKSGNLDGDDGPEPFLAAERQGLARRRGLDQYQHAARAQAVSRSPVPRRRCRGAHECGRSPDDGRSAHANDGRRRRRGGLAQDPLHEGDGSGAE